MDKLAKHGQPRREKTLNETEGINAKQEALLQTATHSHQLTSLASQLAVVSAWVLPCVSAGVCSVYCGELLDKYHCILRHIGINKMKTPPHINPVPQKTMLRCRQLTYQYLEHIQNVTEMQCGSTQLNSDMTVVSPTIFKALLQSCLDFKRAPSPFVQVYSTL
jgi:hypothetical protein